VVVLEFTEFEEVESDEKWINTMKKELNMIEKKMTYVNQPKHKQ